MNKILVMLMLVMLASCHAGEFTQNREELHTMGTPDCDVSPEKCVAGYPW